MSVTVSISAVQSHTPDVDADEMSTSRHSPSLISISVGADHLWCRKPHGSLRSFSLTRTIFLSIPSIFARIQSSRSQYFTSTNHLSCGFYLNFLLKDCFKKPPYAIRPLIGSTAVTSHARRGTFRSLFKIFEYAAKQACKQLQCNKAKLLEPTSINGLHIHRGSSQHN